MVPFLSLLFFWKTRKRSRREFRFRARNRFLLFPAWEKRPICMKVYILPLVYLRSDLCLWFFVVLFGFLSRTESLLIYLRPILIHNGKAFFPFFLAFFPKSFTLLSGQGRISQSQKWIVERKKTEIYVYICLSGGGCNAENPVQLFSSRRALHAGKQLSRSPVSSPFPASV